MSGPKITILGAGSFFFGKPVIWNMATSAILREGTLALVDTNPEVLATMEQLARRTFDHLGVPTRIEASIDRRDVIGGSDFVVPSFSDRNTRFRGIDCEISDKYGIRMCSGDTIGPGGIFRALREIPHLMEMARDVEELCPQAWMINFVNPSTVLGIALAKYAPNVRSMALCDGPHEPHVSLRLLKRVGILPDTATSVPTDVQSRLDLRLTGVNHFSWVVHFTYEGRDYLPVLREKLAETAAKEQADTALQTDSLDVHQNAHAKGRFNATYSLKLFDLFGAYPDCIAHTKEYVPYFQQCGVSPIEPEAIKIFDAVDRQQKMDEAWATTKAYATGDKPIEEFITDGKGDHATDIIESMWGGMGKVFRVNTTNRGAVPNMPDDAYLELASHLDMKHCQPLAVGNLPVGVRGLCQRILDSHELTADAAVACDRNLLLRACATDPIMPNLVDNEKICDELLERERDALPAAWYADQPAPEPVASA